MLPVTVPVVFIERIRATPARLSTTIAISAMNRTTPCWRRGSYQRASTRCMKSGSVVEDGVAHRDDRLVDPMPVRIDEDGVVDLHPSLASGIVRRAVEQPSGLALKLWVRRIREVLLVAANDDGNPDQVDTRQALRG